MKPLSHAILIEPAHGGELQPLLAERAFAMLPLANRPLVHHHVAALAAAGMREVDLFLGHHPQQTRDFVAAGQAWGLTLRCHSLSGSERLWSEPDRLRRFVREASLVLAMDHLPGPHLLAQLCAPEAAGSCWLHDEAGSGMRVGRLVLHSPTTTLQSAAPVLRLLRARDYVRANQDALTALAGTHHVERVLGSALLAGARARIDETAHLPGAALLGAGAVIGRRCAVGDGAVLGAGVRLDDDAEVRDSVLLADTYVGPHGHLVGKVVDRACVIDCATGVAMHVDDPRLLGSGTEHLFSDASLTRLWERALAAACLGLLAPVLAARALWCAARGRSLFERETRYLAPRRALDGQALDRPLALHSLAGVTHPAWRRLPWLISVMRGELPLVGSALPPRRPPRPGPDRAESLFAMLRCAPAEVASSLAHLDFLRDVGPRLSTRAALGWLASLFRTRPEGVLP